MNTDYHLHCRGLRIYARASSLRPALGVCNPSSPDWRGCHSVKLVVGVWGSPCRPPVAGISVGADSSMYLLPGNVCSPSFMPCMRKSYLGAVNRVFLQSLLAPALTRPHADRCERAHEAARTWKWTEKKTGRQNLSLHLSPGNPRRIKSRKNRSAGWVFHNACSPDFYRIHAGCCTAAFGIRKGRRNLSLRVIQLRENPFQRRTTLRFP